LYEREKVKTEWELVSIAHNLQKLATGSTASFFTTINALVGWLFYKIWGLSGGSSQTAPSLISPFGYA